MILNAIRQKLIDEDVVEGSTGWKCFIGHDPDVQDQTVVLQLTGGFEPDTHGAENLWQSVQVRVRSAELEYETCYNKWREVFDSLDNQTIDSDGIFFMQALTGGPLAWTDERRRQNMSMNLRVGVSA